MKKLRTKRRMLAFLLALVMIISQIAGGTGMTVLAEGTEEGTGVQEEIYDYQFPVGDDINLLPYWNHGIGKYFNCWVQNEEYPEGADITVEITNLTVENAEDEESEDDVVSYWQWDDGNGWEIHMNSYGHAIGTITYTTVDGGEATKTFNIWGSDAVYSVDAWSDTEVWQMLPGDTINVTPNVWLECYNEEDGHFMGDTSNVTLEWTYGENDENWAEAFTVSEDAESKVLTIQALEGSQDRNIQLQLRAYVPDENGEPQEVAYNEWWVESCHGYAKITLASDTYVETDLAIGAETTLAPELWEYAYNEEGNQEYQITENLQYRVEFDTNALQIADVNGKVLTNEDSMGTAPFTIKKLENWHTDINLLAMQPDENGEYVEAARRSWHFNELNYDVWFEELRGGDHTWMYVSEDNSTGEEYTLPLNIENLTNKSEDSYTLEWLVGIWDEEQEKTITLNLDDAQDIYTITREGNYEIIAFQAEKLKAALVEQFGDTYGLSMEDNIWANVEAKVYAGEGENRQDVAGCGNGIEIRNERIEYYFPVDDDIQMLPNWGHDISKNFDCYVENKDYPEGVNLTLEITGLTVENAEDEESEEPVATCTPWDDGEGWQIDMNSFGHAVGTLTYIDVDGSEAAKTFNIWGCDAIHYAGIETNTGVQQLLPGETLDLTARAWADYYDENGNYTEDAEDVVFGWTWGENDENYAEAFSVSVDENDPKVLHVTALENSQGRNIQIQLRVYRQDENGELNEVAYTDMWLDSCDFYYTLEMESPVETDLKIGQETTLVPQLWQHNVTEEGNQSQQVTENLQYRVEFDTNAVQVTDVNGKVLTDEDNMGTAPFTVQRLKNWETDITLLAMLPDENGDYYEVLRNNWWFNEQKCDIWFDNLRGDNYSWIFASEEDANENEDYTLNLNTENLEGMPEDAYEIQWQVGYLNEEDIFTTLDANGGAYEISADGTSITLHSGEVRNQFKDLMGLEEDNPYIWFNVEARVFVGEEEISMANTGMEINTPEYYIEEYYGLYSFAGDMVVHDSMVYENAQVSCYVRNKDYPHGESVPFEITDIEVSGMDAQEEAVFEVQHNEEENCWTVTAVNCGDGQVTYHTNHESYGEKEFTLPVSVSEDVYRLRVWNETDTTHLLQGKSVTFFLEGAHFFYDEASGEVTGEVMDLSDCIFTVENRNEGMITIGEIEDGAFTITAENEQWGDAWFDVTMTPVDNPDYLRSAGCSIHVTDCYYQAFAEEVIAAPGEKVEIPVVLKKFDLDHPEGMEMEDVTYHLEGFGSERIILDETGTGVTVAKNAATVEDVPQGVMVRCIAEMVDENNNHIYEEVTGVVIICAHNWKETARTEATCTTAGSVTYQCTKCETEKTETIAAKGHTAGAWETTKEATCTEAGSKVQKCTVCKAVLKTETIAAKGHTAGAWETTKEATCTEAGSKVQKCTVCKAVLKTESIAKIKGTVKLNVKSIPLQVKKSTNVVKITSITEGDSVAKWSSSNTKVATVNSKGKITGKKVGTAKITVTTKSGATATVTVKVQKKAVTTKKLTVKGKDVVIKKNKLTLKKGKTANLLVTLNPLTSTDKVSYTISGKKIVTVSKSGKIKAKKVGKTKIIVKSGKKKVTITVTVKK